MADFSKHAEAVSIWLELLRGVAALLVLVAHTKHIVFGPGYGELHEVTSSFVLSTIHALGSYGHTSVIVFFVISGLLVGGPLLQAQLLGRASYKSYAIARITRIVPVFVPAVLLSALLLELIVFFSGTDPVKFRSEFFDGQAIIEQNHLANIAKVLLFTQDIFAIPAGGNVSLWSVVNEVWYYALLPCLLMLGLGKRLVAALPLLLILLLFAESAKASFFIVYLLIWLMGVALHLVLASPRTWVQRLAAVGLVSAVMLLKIGIPQMELDDAQRQFARDITVALGTAFSVVFLVIANVAVPFRRLWAFLARHSFSVYAFHMPFLLLFASLGGYAGRFATADLHGAGVFALIGAATFAATLVAWQFTEKHSPKLRKVLSERYLGGTTAAAVH